MDNRKILLFFTFILFFMFICKLKNKNYDIIIENWNSMEFWRFENLASNIVNDKQILDINKVSTKKLSIWELDIKTYINDLIDLKFLPLKKKSNDFKKLQLLPLQSGIKNMADDLGLPNEITKIT